MAIRDVSNKPDDQVPDWARRSRESKRRARDAERKRRKEEIERKEAEDFCPLCGSQLDAKMSGVECPDKECGYRFCY